MAAAPKRAAPGAAEGRAAEASVARCPRPPGWRRQTGGDEDAAAGHKSLTSFIVQGSLHLVSQALSAE